MAFCEQCGAKLMPGARFCEECGTAVESDLADKGGVVEGSDADKAECIFEGANWESAWAQVAASCGCDDFGLIVTCESALLKQTGIEPSEYNALIRKYIAAAKNRGVHYCYMDLECCPFYDGRVDVDSVIAALRPVVDVARPKYLFILGNEEIIPVVSWENQASDGDADVESDLCYATLDASTPWNGQKYNFSEVIRVGRLPTYTDEGFESFSAYLENAIKYMGTLNGVVAYGLSALVWRDETNDEYRAVSHGEVEVSPEVTKDTVANGIPDDANLLFFNLHGSNDTRYWYGQDGSDYPEAFAPEVLEGRARPYFLGVEACYGARYLGGLSPRDSIVQMAMRNKCLAFLGSSKIAFGTSQPEGSCADIVIGNYIKFVADGWSAGDAYIEGLKRLTSDWSSMDDSDVKTMAEFALYGDPSARMRMSKSVGGMKGFFKGIGGVPKGLNVPMSDVRNAVRMALTEVDEKIEAIIDDFVARQLLPDLSRAGLGGVEQQVFKMKNTGLNQKVYRYRPGSVPCIVKIYFDDRGKIHKAVISK